FFHLFSNGVLFVSSILYSSVISPNPFLRTRSLSKAGAKVEAFSFSASVSARFFKDFLMTQKPA
ncbi:MAG: hypothetical protein J6W13_00180, partial [Salinivirgaceae bacterium]|nr:hypothetical protein [Salinivirgaceae bacterium]